MKTPKNLDLSVVVPVFNSSKIIGELNYQIHNSLSKSKYNYEIIYVCDGSPDSSWNEIKKISSNEKVKGILLRNNFGQHNALMAGLKRSAGNFVVTIDDDLQHSPKDIHKLINANYDVVYGNFKEKKHPKWKIFGSFASNFLANVLLRKPRSVAISPFRSIKREVVLEMVKYSGPYTYLDALIFNITSSVVSVEVTHNKRFLGESNYGLKKSISLLIKMTLSSSIYPLRITTLLGFIISISGFFSALYLIVLKTNNHVSVSGWSSLMVTVLLVSGIQLIALGFIGEYIGRSYMINNNSLKQFSEKEIIGFDKNNKK
jgi:glycosyltransferase involved in cell wall biosynthesis